MIPKNFKESVQYNPEFFREVMKYHNLTVREMAEKLGHGVTTSTVFRILSHNFFFIKGFKKAQMIDALRYTFGVSNPDDFFNTDEKLRPIIIKENAITHKEVKTMDQRTLEYFGLKRDPFVSPQIVNPEKLWFNGEYRYILDKVLSAAAYQTFLAVIGSVGSGKSNLINRARKDFRNMDNIRISYISPMSVGSMNDRAILAKILKDIGEEIPPLTIDDRAEQLSELLSTFEEAETRTIVLIDDAHNLPPEGLRALRYLVESSPLVSVILFAQPRLNENLHTIALKEVDDRLEKINIIAFRRKEPDHQQVQHYIQSRLNDGGALTFDIFEPAVIKRLGEVANTPLDVNNIFRASLIKAAKIKEPKVTLEILESVLKTVLN